MVKKVIVAMSGGVDSSVAAALLKRAGFYVVGVFMKFWLTPKLSSPAADFGCQRQEFDDGWAGYNRCCSPESEKRAGWVAKSLGIPFYILNLEKEFKKKVVDYFLDGYKKGITPNPCVVCNKEIKFGLLLEKALAMDADFIATGHYARIRKFVSSKKIHYSLISAKDKEKDQSYFLWQLTQKQLRHILFPIGDYTKTEIKGLAKRFKLPVFDVPESQEICFIPNGDIGEFLKSQIKAKKGKIVSPKREKNIKMFNSCVIGEHKGLCFYTIGQRKGIGLSGGPYYVLDKDLKKNLLIVTKNEKSLYKKGLIAKNVNWISGEKPKLPITVKAKIRYRHNAALATINSLKPTVYKLKFKIAQRAITPGQSVVFYKGNELLGGGIIC